MHFFVCERFCVAHICHYKTNSYNLQYGFEYSCSSLLFSTLWLYITNHDVFVFIITWVHRWCSHWACNNTKCEQTRTAQSKMLRYRLHKFHHDSENICINWLIFGDIDKRIGWFVELLTSAIEYVLHVTVMPMIKNKIPRPRNRMPRLRVNSGPTDDTLRQCGHLANALCNVLNWSEKIVQNSLKKIIESLRSKASGRLTKNVSEQWPHVTRHIPGNDDTGGVTGLGAKFMIRLQFGRGHAILCDELLQIRRQLHGHRTYFLPGGAFRIGCKCISKEQIKLLLRNVMFCFNLY